MKIAIATGSPAAVFFTTSPFILILTMVLMGCVAGGNAQRRRGADPATMAYQKQIADKKKMFEDEAKVRRAKIALVPLNTRGVIVRGAQKVPIDFARADEAKKVQDFDVVLLEEGRYELGGNFKAYGARFVGKGRDKTFITPTLEAPIKVNSTDFWDVTIVDGHFEASEGVGFWLAHGELIGPMIVKSRSGLLPIRQAIGTVWSVVTYSDVANVGNGNTRHLYSIDQKTHDRGELSPSAMVGVNRMWHTERAGSNATNEKIERAAYDHYRTSGTFFGPRLKAVLEESHAAFWPELEPRANLGADYKLRSKMLFAKAMTYATVSGHATPRYDTGQFNGEMQKALDAKKRGRHILALYHFDNANSISGYTKAAEIQKLAAPLSRELREDSGCTIEIAPDSWMETFRAVALGKFIKYKVLSLNLGHKCAFVFNSIHEKGPTVRGGQKAVGSAGSIEVETDESRKRRHDADMQKAALDRAADRAASRARQAKLDASVEQMKDTARKMEAGRVKVDTVGDQKVMTYGTGNWAGQASASTVNAANSNAAEAQRLRQQAAGVGGSEAETRTVNLALMEGSEVTVTKYKPWMEWDAEGVIKKVEGPDVAVQTIRTCRTQERYGAFGGNSVAGGGCREWEDAETSVKPVVEKFFLPSIEGMVRKTLGNQERRGERLAKSSDPADQLEASVLIEYYGAPGKIPPAHNLTPKVLGGQIFADRLLFTAVNMF